MLTWCAMSTGIGYQSVQGAKGGWSEISLPWSWGKASQQRWYWRCILNDKEFARGLGRGGKPVWTKGVFQSKGVSWRMSAKTFFHFWTHCPAGHTDPGDLCWLVELFFLLLKSANARLSMFHICLKNPGSLYLPDLWWHETHFHLKFDCGVFFTTPSHFL